MGMGMLGTRCDCEHGSLGALKILPQENRVELRKYKAYLCSTKIVYFLGILMPQWNAHAVHQKGGFALLRGAKRSALNLHHRPSSLATTSSSTTRPSHPAALLSGY